ncbi:MAG: hypothetical protein JKX94_06215 [Sneathiella sp.]|nr:hypothetical protein [Sneathiella sp.]
MSASNDSIQTLLKQRRELRGYLQELRGEINKLNSRADEIVKDKVGKTNIEPDPTKTESVGASPEPAGATTPTQGSKISAPVLVAAPPSDPDAEKVDTRQEGETEKQATLSDKGKVQKQSETEQPVLKKADLPENSEQVADDKNKPEDFSNIDHDSLLYRAKLLSDYFLNHPTSIDKSALVNLDEAIKKSEDAPTPEELDKEISQLRNAYRIVASKSYQNTGINGETLSDSRSDISLLWAVPLYIAGLTLVVFPLVLLGRSLSTRMFVDDFSDEMTFIMTAIVAFLWGSVGALSYLAWGVAKLAKTYTYQTGCIRDVGLRATLGGVLGIIVFLGLSSFISIDSIVPDMTIGILSFFSGLASSIIYAFLHGLISKATHKVEKQN